MSDPVTVSLVGAFASIVVACVTVVGGRLIGRMKAVQAQVENEHQNSPTPNLRDDLDQKHRVVLGLLATVQRDLAWLMRQQAETDRRVDDIEDTIGKDPS